MAMPARVYWGSAIFDRVIRRRPRRQPIARHAGLGSFLMRVEVQVRVITNILRLNWSRLSRTVGNLARYGGMLWHPAE
jgi:hypothetical protein